MALELIQEYFEGIIAKLEDLNNSLQDNQKENSLRLVHNIKGTTANLRLSSLASLFLSLEEAINTENQVYICNLLGEIKILINKYKESLIYH